jgi:hypothetical protein
MRADLEIRRGRREFLEARQVLFADLLGRDRRDVDRHVLRALGPLARRDDDFLDAAGRGGFRRGLRVGGAGGSRQNQRDCCG